CQRKCSGLLIQPRGHVLRFKGRSVYKIKDGTKECKAQLENTALWHLRAYDQINQAYRCLTKLSRDSDTLDKIVQSALFTSAVIHYARPFGDNRGGSISFSKYRFKDLKQARVDRVFHDHLLDLRNKLVAHQDGTLLSAKIGQLMIEIP